jgi:hypothetical protein
MNMLAARLIEVKILLSSLNQFCSKVMKMNLMRSKQDLCLLLRNNERYL